MHHRARGRRLFGSAAAALLGAAVASCAAAHSEPAYPDLAGVHVEVVGAWADGEQARFERVLADFTARTGAHVTYIPAHDTVPKLLDARLAEGDPPDVALLPQPGLLRRYAQASRLVPLDDDTQRLVRGEYASVWLRLASSDGHLYGVWFKAANKSLMWYDVAAFERTGIAPPERLAALPAVARAMRVRGIPPFAVGGKDEWTLTDWFENLYLQLSGPRAYDRLADHRMSWTDPSVVRCLRLMSRLLTPQNLRGGVAGTLQTGFDDSVALAFGAAPATGMVVEGDFVAGVLRARTDAQIGIDVDAVPFPAAHPSVPAIVGGGDVAVQLRPSRAGRVLMRYLATSEAASVWARAGGFISPNENVDFSVYPDALTRSIARSLVQAGDSFRFDLSDLQPATFGSTPGAGMQQAFANLLISRDIAGTAQHLERTAAAAYAEEPR